MKKIKKVLFIIILLSLSSFGLVHGEDSTKNNISDNLVTQNEQINRGYVFSFLGSLIDEIPNSYKYIELKYKNVEKGSKLEDALKKFVYLDRIPNEKIDLRFNDKIEAFEFYSLARLLLNLGLSPDIQDLSGKSLNMEDLTYIRNSYYSIGELDEKRDNTETNIEIEVGSQQNNFGNQGLIMENILNVLTTMHYDHENLDKEKLLYGAIEGMVDAAGDTHTSYFPPLESKSFEDSLAGEYQGIGAYVQMTSPGIVEITNPISGSPAEKAGIKGGDIIKKVDGKEIKKENSLNEVTSWIKGPEGTKVNLAIERDGKELEIEISREKIVIKNIEYEELYPNTAYIKINAFNAGVANEFAETLKSIKGKNINKIILDLRNNGGGLLHEVNYILSNLIEKGEKISVIKYLQINQNHYSEGPLLINLNDYKVVILQNSGTASASEIMIGTLLDYYPNIINIGENTYGKGSVQSMINFNDGSMIKYTSAKWFTGGTETGIDGVGIAPKQELELDIEAFQNGKDNQLEAALNL